MDKDIVILISKVIQMIGEIDAYIQEHVLLSDIITQESYVIKQEEINKSFSKLNSVKKLELFCVLEKEFNDDPSMHIFLLSIILKCTHEFIVLNHLVDVVCKVNLSVYQNATLEYQVAYETFTNDYLQNEVYQLRRRLHSHTVKQFTSIAKMPSLFLPYEKRNKNRIVIMTEQVVGANHAPTKIILDQCYAMQRNLGIEVYLIICPVHAILEDQTLWNELMHQNYLDLLNGGYRVSYREGNVYADKLEGTDTFIIVYKDEEIYGKQVLFDKVNSHAHDGLLKLIYDLNPMFVYNMGCVNPIADACANFTTVVSSVMSHGYPLSDAPILLLLEQGLSVNDTPFDELTDYGQKVISYKLGFEIEDMGMKHTRSEFGIQDDKFILTIVGNRLSAEMTDDFICALKSIFEQMPNVSLVLIGKYDEYQTDFADEVFNDRVHYLGYQKHLLSILRLSNLYLNPPRKGGGTSALIALYAGVPVLTLPNCDVAGNVGQAFTYCHIGELNHLVKRYCSDEQFYKDQQELGLKHILELTDTSSMLKEVISNVEKVIMDMEKERTYAG